MVWGYYGVVFSALDPEWIHDDHIKKKGFDHHHQDESKFNIREIVFLETVNFTRPLITSNGVLLQVGDVSCTLE